MPKSVSFNPKVQVKEISVSYDDHVQEIKNPQNIISVVDKIEKMDTSNVIEGSAEHSKKPGLPYFLILLILLIIIIYAIRTQHRQTNVISRSDGVVNTTANIQSFRNTYDIQ